MRYLVLHVKVSKEVLVASEPVSLFACSHENLLQKQHQKNCPSLQVVIATSSLSELDMDAFYWYYNLLLPRTTYLLYAYSKVSLSLVPSARLSHSPLSLANRTRRQKSQSQYTPVAQINNGKCLCVCLPNNGACTCQVWPSREIVEEKLGLLMERFTVVERVETNRNNTVSIIFRAK